MTAIEKGRVCVKTKGRNAGKYCVITKVIDNNFVEIAGPKKLNGLKRKRCNINHIEATEDKLDVKAKSTDNDIENMIKKAKLTEKIKEGIKFK